MRFLTPIAGMCRRAFALIFRHHVTLRVAPGGVRVVMEDRPSLPARERLPTRAELAARKSQQEFQLMQQQLAELLNDLPETRTTLRHLVFVEKALARKGLRALQKLPVEVLQRALEQLEGVVVNWSPVGLAALRSRIAVAIIDRDNQLNGAQAEADTYRTAAVMDTLPDTAFEDGVEVSSDDDALAAAYAALGDLAPAAVELQGDLGSTSARALAQHAARQGTDLPGAIRIHELQR
jgi:hypothetical protein